jgi:hypothetical protein
MLFDPSTSFSPARQPTCWFADVNHGGFEDQVTRQLRRLFERCVRGLAFRVPKGRLRHVMYPRGPEHGLGTHVK